MMTDLKVLWVLRGEFGMDAVGPLVVLSRQLCLYNKVVSVTDLLPMML
jgi:hypothetical protein